MSKRTTLLLDGDTLAAAQELALQYGFSTAEIIRRAVVRHRETELGLTEDRRQEQVRLLRRLFRSLRGPRRGGRGVTAQGRGILATGHVDTRLLDYKIHRCQWISSDLALVHPVDSIVMYSPITAEFCWNIQP